MELIFGTERAYVILRTVIITDKDLIFFYFQFAYYRAVKLVMRSYKNIFSKVFDVSLFNVVTDKKCIS